MIVEYLIKGNTIAFSSPYLPEGGFELRECKDLELAKKTMLEHFHLNLKLPNATLKKVDKFKSFWVQGIHTL